MKEKGQISHSVSCLCLWWITWTRVDAFYVPGVTGAGSYVGNMTQPPNLGRECFTAKCLPLQPPSAALVLGHPLPGDRALRRWCKFCISQGHLKSLLEGTTLPYFTSISYSGRLRYYGCQVVSRPLYSLKIIEDSECLLFMWIRALNIYYARKCNWEIEKYLLIENNDKPITYQHNQLFLMKTATIYFPKQISVRRVALFFIFKYLMPGLIDDTWILSSHSAFSP